MHLYFKKYNNQYFINLLTLIFFSTTHLSSIMNTNTCSFHTVQVLSCFILSTVCSGMYAAEGFVCVHLPTEVDGGAAMDMKIY